MSSKTKTRHPSNANANPSANHDSDYDNDTYTQALNYSLQDDTNDDYYTILGLPQPSTASPVTDHDIRAAYRTLTFSFHPDKQPPHLREAAQRHFERINEAYETLIDVRKRAVYDLVGAEGVRREWSASGLMGKGEKGVGVRAKSPEEFRRWFLDLMKKRERAVVNGMVQSRVWSCPCSLLPFPPAGNEQSANC